jgi:hypothetical protein
VTGAEVEGDEVERIERRETQARGHLSRGVLMT